MARPPSCAECEASLATLLCEDEELLFCAPCSRSLHAKRARAHHIVRPLRICDHCEIAVALFTCSSCGGRGDPLSFCFPCSSNLHSKKARAHHKVDHILFTQPFIPANDVNHAHKGLHNHGGRFPFAESRPNKSEIKTKEPLPCYGKKGPGISADSGSPKNSPVQTRPRKEERNQVPVPKEEPKSRLTHPQSSNNKENQGPAGQGNPRRRHIQLQPGGCEDVSSSSSEGDTSEDDETYGTKKYRKGTVTLEAFVVDVHDHEDRHPGSHLELKEDQPEGGVQVRIRKMLELGLHPDTPDIEAQQALKNAQRLLTKHNLQQADVLKGGLEANKHAFKAGMRMVELRPRDKSKPGRFEHWVYSLARIVSKYFDTQYFVQKQAVLQVVFYGIRQNVDCAGYAFAATFNRISKLSADYLPSRQPSDGKKASKTCSSQSVYSRVSRMSYRNGLVEGLFETVKARKVHQKKEKVGKEGKEKQKKDSATSCGDARTDETISLSSSDDECRSNDASNDRCSDDANSADECMSEDADCGSSDEWGKDESAALTALVVHSKKIGDDLLKEKKIKVTTRRQDSPVIWDGEAFLKGKRDSKTIDLGQKGITDKARKRAAI